MPATEGTLPVNRLWQYQRDLVLLRSLVTIVEAEVACSCSKDKKKDVCRYMRLFRMSNLYSPRTRRLCRIGNLVPPGAQVTSRLYYVII